MTLTFREYEPSFSVNTTPSNIVATLTDDPKTWSIWDDSLGKWKEFKAEPLCQAGLATSWKIIESDSDNIHEKRQLITQYVLKFSGTTSRDTLKEVLEYLVANKENIHLVFIEGPVDGNIYHLDDSDINKWHSAIQLTTMTYEGHVQGRAQLFLDAPASLVFSFAQKLNKERSYDCFTYREEADIKDRYKCIYSMDPQED